MRPNTKKQNKSELSAAKQILDDDQKAPRSVRTLGRSLPKPGPTLQSLVEREERRLRTLIEQHNALQFAVCTKESQVLELEQCLKDLELDSVPDMNEKQYDQRVRQLENRLEKMNVKIQEAKKIQKTYLRIQEHLRKELREMPRDLDKLQNTVVSGLTEISKATQTAQAAMAEVDTTKATLVQMERKQMAESTAMEEELNMRKAEKEREVEGRTEREREGMAGERRNSRGPQRSKDQGKKSGRDGLAEDTYPVPIKVQQSAPQPSTSKAMVKLMSDLDDLKEVLSCSDLQDLGNRLVSQKTTMEQLQSQMKRCEELVEERQQRLAALELQYAQLKFGTGTGSEKYEQLRVKLQEELEREQERCSQWESKLSKALSVLSVMEQGVDNLFYRMICVPTQEELPQEGNLSALEKLRIIDTQLPVLKLSISGQTEDGSTDQEKLWDFLEHSTMIEPRNYRRVNSPVHDSSLGDKYSFQFWSQEEDCVPSRDEIKQRGVELMKAHQQKKKAQKGSRKS